jgi:hypothetical protein
VLRLLDARSGSYAEIRPARPGLLRVSAHVPGATGTTDITWLRVLLVADVRARAAETRDLQALTAFVFAVEASAQAGARAIVSAPPPRCHPISSTGATLTRRGNRTTERQRPQPRTDPHQRTKFSRQRDRPRRSSFVREFWPHLALGP